MRTRVEHDSIIYARIREARMTDLEREIAFAALRDAERIVDGIMWVTKKVEPLAARLFLKPAVRHTLKHSLKH
jgi:hypothetical protein